MAVEAFSCIDLKLALNVGFHQYLPIPKLVVKLFGAAHGARSLLVSTASALGIQAVSW